IIIVVIEIFLLGLFCPRLEYLCPELLGVLSQIDDGFNGMRCEFFAAFPDHLQPWVSRVQETVLASKAEGTIRTYLADFKRWKLWALSNGFCHMPAYTFHVATSLQCLILKQILLLLHLMLFTVSTGFNAWPVCLGQTNFVTGRVLQSRGQIKKAFSQYIVAAKIDLDEDLPLFRALSSSRSTSKVRHQG
ncbi:hypothetical protein P5673_011922, partial [Acropora cervicornis]